MTDRYIETCKIIQENKLVQEGNVLDYTGYETEAELDHIYNFYCETLKIHKDTYGVDPAVLYYINDNRVNAVAFKKNGYYIAGLNLGTVTFLQTHFKNNDGLLKVKGVDEYLEFEKLLDTPNNIM